MRETAPIAKCFALIIASRARAAVLLVFVALCAFLPGFTAIPPVDRDEPRYAQASKQMMEKETISTSGFRSRLATFSRPASTGSKSRRPRSLVTGPKLQSGFTDCRPFWRRRRQLSSLIGWHCRLQGLSVRSLPRYFYALHSPWCRGAACENGRGVARLHPERDRISGARLLRVG